LIKPDEETAFVTKLDVSVVGELNLDLILYGLPEKFELEREHLAKHLTITLGSSSAIFAHNLACLGNSVGFSSGIGSDSFGEICKERLAEAKVDLAGVKRFPGKITGLTAILPQSAGRYILTYPGTMRDLKFQDLDLDYILAAKHLHVSSYYLQTGLRPNFAELFRRAKESGLTTSLDTNDDPEDRWSDEVQDVLRYVDVFLPNESEACKIANAEQLEAAAQILSKQVSLLVVKRGGRGGVAWRGNERVVAPAVSATAVDSVGAGDSFDAGFIHQFIRGATIESCLQFANVTGALSVTRAGGTEAFRDAAHRQHFLRDRWADSLSSGL
jgi:sugar/nucleoside kinase (ribokinase family)